MYYINFYWTRELSVNVGSVLLIEEKEKSSDIAESRAKVGYIL